MIRGKKLLNDLTKVSYLTRRVMRLVVTLFIVCVNLRFGAIVLIVRILVIWVPMVLVCLSIRVRWRWCDRL